MKVNAVAYFRVIDAVARSIVQVENYLVATSQIAQTTLRSVLGQVDLDQLLSERDQINERLQAIIDEQTHPWGVKVVGRRGEGRRAADEHAARHRPPGRGRAGAAREDHRRRR